MSPLHCCVVHPLCRSPSRWISFLLAPLFLYSQVCGLRDFLQVALLTRFVYQRKTLGFSSHKYILWTTIQRRIIFLQACRQCFIVLPVHLICQLVLHKLSISPLNKLGVMRTHCPSVRRDQNIMISWPPSIHIIPVPFKSVNTT